MKRITILAAAGVLVAAPAVGAWSAFGATDDPPTQASQTRIDDRRGEAEPTDDHGQRHGGHGADDPTGQPQRHHLGHHHGHGADDPAGHVRHSGEIEPGDDHGGDDGSRHGSDDGGHHGSDDGGHHGGDDDGSGHH
jgi:hypothetical protein